jgi:short-subunit dehydrogenase
MEENLKKTVLITGASSGIGYEFSKIFSSNGYNLVLVSRDAEKLNRLAQELMDQFDIRATVISKDLSEPASARALYDEVIADGIHIDVLINNAGFGISGKFTDTSAEHQMRLVQLNIGTPTMLCRLFGADMAKQGSGQILNVASTAAFQAGPLMSTYYASKAYILLFSEAIRWELRKDHVTVTVLCPGPTRTQFFNRSTMTGTKLEKSPFIMRAARVAELGFAGLQEGKALVIPGLINKLLVFSVRLAPRPVIIAIASFLNR